MKKYFGLRFFYPLLISEIKILATVNYDPDETAVTVMCDPEKNLGSEVE